MGWADDVALGVKSGAGKLLDMGMGQAGFMSAYNPNRSSFVDPNADANKRSLAAALAARQGVGVPQAQAAGIDLGQMQQAQMDPTQQAQFRGDQQSLVQALQARAMGQGGPSQAEMQMRQGMGDIARQQRAAAAGARGMSPALAQKMAAQNIAQAQQGMVGQTGMLRAQEQAQAQQSLGSVLSGARGQDIGMTQLGQQGSMFNAGQFNQALGQNAGFQQQAGLANQQAALQAQGQQDAMQQFFMGNQLGIDANQFAATQGYEQMRSSNENAEMATNAGIADGNANRGQRAFGGVVGAAGSALGGVLSDERQKTNVDRGNKVGKHLGEFLSKLDPVAFDYKDEKFGKGRHYGFMAQDAERSALGKALVMETQHGKMIDTNKALMASLAAASHLSKRLDKMEDK